MKFLKISRSRLIVNWSVCWFFKPLLDLQAPGRIAVIEDGREIAFVDGVPSRDQPRGPGDVVAEDDPVAVLVEPFPGNIVEEGFAVRPIRVRPSGAEALDAEGV